MADVKKVKAIQLLVGPPRDVEDFPKGAARSVKGALHLIPGVTTEVTEDEYKHLVSKKLRLLLLVPEETAPVAAKADEPKDATKDGKKSGKKPDGDAQ